MGVIKDRISIFHIRGFGKHLPEPVDAMIVSAGQTKTGRNDLVEALADTFRNNDHRIAAEAVSVETAPDYEGEIEIFLKVRFHGSAKDNRPEFDRWVKFCVEKAAREVAGSRRGNPGQADELCLTDRAAAYDREGNPTNSKNSRRIMHRAGQGMTGYVGGFGEPYYGVYAVEERGAGGYAAYLRERHADVPQTLLPFVFTARSKPKISARLDELTEQARAALGGHREGNPAKSGFSLYWTAVGAAVGAAAMHFSMKPKQ